MTTADAIAKKPAPEIDTRRHREKPQRLGRRLLATLKIAAPFRPLKRDASCGSGLGRCRNDRRLGLCLARRVALLVLVIFARRPLHLRGRVELDARLAVLALSLGLLGATREQAKQTQTTLHQATRLDLLLHRAQQLVLLLQLGVDFPLLQVLLPLLLLPQNKKFG